MLVAVAVWGVTAWGFFPPQQARLIGIAGLKNAPIILSLNSSFQYLGFSLGAALGSLTLAVGGLDDLGWVGGTCVAAALPRHRPRHPLTGEDRISDLLDLAVTAHGDLERWNTLRTIKLELSVGGALWDLKGQTGLFANATYEADIHKERATLGRFGSP